MHEPEDEGVQPTDALSYEAPAVESRERLQDPLIGAVSGMMM
jgi:hypothetical protein